MSTKRSTRDRLVAGLLLATTLGVASCESAATVETHDFPSVATVRMTIAGRTIVVDGLGTQTGGPAVILANSTAPVVATFHMANGVIDPLVRQETFQLNVQHIAGAPLTFARSETNLFSGTLTATSQTGGSSLRISLHNHKTGATQFGPYNITLSVTQ